MRLLVLSYILLNVISYTCFFWAANHAIRYIPVSVCLEKHGRPPVPLHSHCGLPAFLGAYKARDAAAIVAALRLVLQ